MTRILLGVALCAALLAVALSACGGSGSGPPPPELAVTAVDPATGPVTGGTALTITGTGFAAGAGVSVGANAAAEVVVASSTTITCATPAGTAGAADVAVIVAGATATWSGTFTYTTLAPPPTVTAVDPPEGTTFGGLQVTVTGTGFSSNGAGPSSVSFGGVPATGVVTVSDTSLTCVSPAMPAGMNAAVDAVVTNGNGSSGAGSSFTYYEPILAAMGGGNPAPASWDLFTIQPATGVGTVVGPIGTGVTGMDFDPVTGDLFGTTAPGAMSVQRELIRIDPLTGTGAAIGETDDGAMANHNVADCSFVGDTLYGVSVEFTGFTLNLVSIDTASALVTIVAPVPMTDEGFGFAAGATSMGVFHCSNDTAPLYTVDVVTGTFTPGPDLNGFVQPDSVITCGTFHEGTLYLVDVSNSGGGGNPSPGQLLTVDTVTGLLTPLGPPLPLRISALASRTR